jgi:hypothetical protein
MRRRGFLAAIAGFFTWTLWGKKKPTAENTWLRDTMRRARPTTKWPDGGRTHDSEVKSVWEPLIKRSALGDMIKEAQANYRTKHGKYPNNLYLGRDEYTIWTWGYPEVFGHTTKHMKGGNGEAFGEYPLAYGMLVYVKSEYTDVKKLDSDEFYQHAVKSHLSVDLCTEKVTKDTHKQVLSTVGFKVMT